MPKKQNGFLLIGAVILIIIMGTMGVYVARIANTNANTGSLYRDANDASSLANSALEKVTEALLSPDLSKRVSCENLQSHFDTYTLGQGQFRVESTHYYSSNPAQLRLSLSSTDSIIKVNQLTGLASYGRVRIDKEFIDYTGTSTDSGKCDGASHCLTGAKRGRAGSIASAHLAAMPIGQNQCSVTITAVVPSFANTLASHTLRAQILSLDEGWLVSQQPKRTLAIYRFTGAGFDSYTSREFGPHVDPKHVNAISQINYPYARFGANRGGAVNMMEWPGSQIIRTPYHLGTPSQTINSESCITTYDCWATSLQGHLIHLYGLNSWHDARPDHISPLADDADYGIPITTAPGVSPNINVALYGISCTATNSCWAVGSVYDGKPIYEYWNGDKWRRASKYSDETSTGPAQLDRDLLVTNVYSVSCISSSDCWSVGAVRDGQANINHLISGVWTHITAPADLARNLYSVFCLTANDCWAAGQNGGTGVYNTMPLIAHYNGTSWTRQVLPDALPNKTLRNIYCGNKVNCWAAGNSGTLLYYNGSTWTQITVPENVKSKRLNAFSIIAVPHQHPAFIEDL